MLRVSEDIYLSWVVQDRSSNVPWHDEQHKLARQGNAGTALQNGVLCNEHNSNLGGRELNSTFRDLCRELKQV